MAPFFPPRDALQGSVYNPLATHHHLHEAQQSKATPWQARPELYGAYSAVDDPKGAIKNIGAKTGRIELYSGKYYAACVFSGLLACVSPP